MRKLIMLFTLFVALIFSNQGVRAQELVSDQNPNYRASMQKYMSQKDSLMSTMSTTVQDTYKAYDWYESKQERKALRRERRYNIRMARAQNSMSYYRPYYGYNSGYNSYWNWRPRVGYRTGNWMFSM